MAEVGHQLVCMGLQLAVHPYYWYVYLCYLHFAPENPEDGEVYLLVLAHEFCPKQSPQSRKMVVCVYKTSDAGYCLCLFACFFICASCAGILKSFLLHCQQQRYDCM